MGNNNCVDKCNECFNTKQVNLSRDDKILDKNIINVSNNHIESSNNNYNS